jgi:hypothetical protein
MTAAADVTSAPPPPQRAAKHRNQHRGKHGKQQRGVRIFTNAVPHGQPNLPRESSSGETDDDVAQRPDETLDARASEFHPVKPPLNLASYRDAALTVDDEVAPPATETPTGPLSHAAAESSRESSVVLTSNQSETGSEIATAENNARDEKEAAWPRLDASAPVVPSKRASIAVAGTKGAPVIAVRVRDDDGGWRCDECHAHNRDARADCRRCGGRQSFGKKSFGNQNQKNQNFFLLAAGPAAAAAAGTPAAAHHHPRRARRRPRRRGHPVLAVRTLRAAPAQAADAENIEPEPAAAARNRSRNKAAFSARSSRTYPPTTGPRWSARTTSRRFPSPSTTRPTHSPTWMLT